MEVDRKITTVRHPLGLLIQSIRPIQIIVKNAIIFAGILFSGNLFNPMMWLKVIGCYLFFGFLTGGIYLINDLHDRDTDQLHPDKKRRPIAAGLLSASVVLRCAIPGICIGVLGMLFLETRTGFVAIAYLLLMIWYNHTLKHIMLVDCMTLAFGFVLRAIAGALVIAVEISPWFLTCTFYLALLLAVTKRKSEAERLQTQAVLHRTTLKGYRGLLNDLLIAILTTTTLVTYSLYTFNSEHAEALLLTIPLVVYGLFRFLYLIYVEQVIMGMEEIFISDRPLFITVTIWTGLVTAILFF